MGECKGSKFKEKAITHMYEKIGLIGGEAPKYDVIYGRPLCTLLPPMQPTLETLNHSYHCPCPLFCFFCDTLIPGLLATSGSAKASLHVVVVYRLAALQNTADTV